MKPTTYIGVVIFCIFMVCFTSYNIICKVAVPKSIIQNSVALKQSTAQHNTRVIKKWYLYQRIDGDQNLLF